MTIRNRTLFFEIADVLEFQPDRYNQQSWGKFTPDWYAADDPRDAFEAQFGYRPEDGDDYNWVKVEECGTALCVAGHAAMLAGWFPTISSLHDGEGRNTVSWISVCRERHQPCHLGEDVSQVAARELGISSAEGSRLFAGGTEWSPEDLRKFGTGSPILPDDERHSR